MEQYRGLSGDIYLLGEKIGGGGEGTIYRICDNDKQVAKIFKSERRNGDREEKLRHMIEHTWNEEELKVVAWPQDVVYDESGFAGYVMPKVDKASSLSEIYRAGTSGGYDLRCRLLVAINLCYSVKMIHDRGQICGDLNPQNICVNLDVTNMQTAFGVTLVDTDSYHFTAGEKTYRCEVGLADYLAPEIQKILSGETTLRNAPLPTYTKETDLFALAVHVFALLMNGCHPFACAKRMNDGYENSMPQMEAGNIGDSIVAPQPIENIREGYFPFYHQKDRFTYPTYAPSFDSLPEQVQSLFVRTFVDGCQDPLLRVDADEWITVLMDARNYLTPCNANAKHYYFGPRATCPLCDAENRMRQMFMPPGEDAHGSKEESESQYGEIPYLRFEHPIDKKKFWSLKKSFVMCGVAVVIYLIAVIIGWLVDTYGIEKDVMRVIPFDKLYR